MKNGPISVELAEAMMKEYVLYMEAHHVDMNNQTNSISFTGGELIAWLSKVMPYADELRVCLGAYPKDDPNASRTTVILWPYKNGQPATQPYTEGKDGGDGKVPPYNQGGLNP
jgi:hypothetical protein